MIVKRLALCVPERDDMELDLSGDLSKLEKQVSINSVDKACVNIIKIILNDLFLLLYQVFTIKEGVQYRIRIDFIVQREIVHGLKYVQKTSRLAIPGEQTNH